MSRERLHDQLSVIIEIEKEPDLGLSLVVQLGLTLKANYRDDLVCVWFVSLFFQCHSIVSDLLVFSSKICLTRIKKSCAAH